MAQVGGTRRDSFRVMECCGWDCCCWGLDADDIGGDSMSLQGMQSAL